MSTSFCVLESSESKYTAQHHRASAIRLVFSAFARNCDYIGDSLNRSLWSRSELATGRKSAHFTSGCLSRSMPSEKRARDEALRRYVLQRRPRAAGADLLISRFTVTSVGFSYLAASKSHQSARLEMTIVLQECSNFSWACGKMELAPPCFFQTANLRGVALSSAAAKGRVRCMLVPSRPQKTSVLYDTPHRHHPKIWNAEDRHLRRREDSVLAAAAGRSVQIVLLLVFRCLRLRGE